MTSKRIEITSRGLYFIGYSLQETRRLLRLLKLALRAGKVFAWEKIEDRLTLVETKPE